MSTIAINASTPSTTVNLAVLKSVLGRVLELARRNSIQLAPDEYALLWEVMNATTDGTTANTVTAVTMTY